MAGILEIKTQSPSIAVLLPQLTVKEVKVIQDLASIDLAQIGSMSTKEAIQKLPIREVIVSAFGKLSVMSEELGHLIESVRQEDAVRQKLASPNPLYALLASLARAAKKIVGTQRFQEIAESTKVVELLEEVSEAQIEIFGGISRERLEVALLVAKEEKEFQEEILREENPLLFEALVAARRSQALIEATELKQEELTEKIKYFRRIVEKKIQDSSRLLSSGDKEQGVKAQMQRGLTTMQEAQQTLQQLKLTAKEFDQELKADNRQVKEGKKEAIKAALKVVESERTRIESLTEEEEQKKVREVLERLYTRVEKIRGAVQLLIDKVLSEPINRGMVGENERERAAADAAERQREEATRAEELLAETAAQESRAISEEVVPEEVAKTLEGKGVEEGKVMRQTGMLSRASLAVAGGAAGALFGGLIGMTPAAEGAVSSWVGRVSQRFCPTRRQDQGININ